MSWYISEASESDWKLDPGSFIKYLEERWPRAEVREIRNPARKNYSHEWKIRENGHVLEGKFDQSQSAVVLDGNLEEAAAFAAWFRSLVPDERDLLFYDEGLSIQVPLDAGITAGSIIAKTTQS